MTPELKVGDRVVVYGNAIPTTQGPWSGEVVSLKASSLSYDIQVKADYGGFQREVHSKQCRRLKPKAKPIEFWIWLDENGTVEATVYAPPKQPEGWTHVREIKEGKKK